MTTAELASFHQCTGRSWSDDVMYMVPCKLASLYRTNTSMPELETKMSMSHNFIYLNMCYNFIYMIMLVIMNDLQFGKHIKKIYIASLIATIHPLKLAEKVTIRVSASFVTPPLIFLRVLKGACRLYLCTKLITTIPASLGHGSAHRYQV